MNFLSRSQYITAIDFGSDTIKVVVGEHSPQTNNLIIRAVGRASSSTCISNGLILDIESARQCLLKALKNAGINISSNKNLFQNTIVGFEHPECMTTIEESSKEFKFPTLITENHIAELKKNVHSTIQSKYKNEQFYTHTYIYEWFCDGVQVYTPLTMIVKKITLRAYFCLIRELLTNNCRSCIANIPPEDIRKNIMFVYTPIVLAYSTASAVETGSGVLIIDIGKDNTSLVITQNKKIKLLETLPYGISKIASMLTLAFKTDPEESKNLVSSYGVSQEILRKIELVCNGDKSDISTYDFDKILNLIPSQTNPVLLQNNRTIFRSEIEYIVTIGLFEIFHKIYYKHLNTHLNLFHDVILTGGGALTPNLVPLVETIFDMPGRVRVGNPINIPDIPPNTNTSLYAPVLGLLKYYYSENIQSQRKKRHLLFLKNYFPAFIQNLLSFLF